MDTLTTFTGASLNRHSLEGQLMQPLRREVQCALHAVERLMKEIHEEDTLIKRAHCTTERIMGSSKRLSLARKRRLHRATNDHFLLSIINFYDHHIKNLLGGIVFSTSLLKEPALAGDEEILAMATRVMREQAQKLYDIIEGGFTVATLQGDRSSLEELHNCLLHTSAPQSTSKVVRDIQGVWSEGTSIASPVFALIIEELLQNASDANKNTHGEVCIKAFLTEDTLHCHVEDQGGGLHTEDTSLIFEKGFTTKKKQGGTGNGLYLIRNLLEHVQGSIAVFTDTKEGWTRFELEMPIWRA